MSVTTRPYKVRKSFEDSKSQIASYAKVENAIKVAKEHPGYSVYDETGRLVWNPLIGQELNKVVEVKGHISNEVATIEETENVKVNPEEKVILDEEYEKPSFIKRVLNKLFRRS